MDANQQKFWMVRGGSGWDPKAEDGGGLTLNPEFLELASTSDAHEYPEVVDHVEARLKLVPVARDTFGGRAYYDDASKAVFGTSDLPGAAKITDLLSAATDLALGFDGYLYIAIDTGVIVRDMCVRNPSVEVSLDNFSPWRLAPHPDGGAWVLDRTNKNLARLAGQLWPAPLALNVPPDAFRPMEENPNPFRLTIFSASWLKANEEPVAIACTPAGRLAVLVWFANPADPKDLQARVRIVETDTTAAAKTATLKEIQRPFSLAWISEDRFAVIAQGVSEAIVYEFADGKVSATGEIFPLRDHDAGPFMHGVSLPVEYLSKQPTDDEPARIVPRPLVSLSLPAFPSRAAAYLKVPLDSGAAGTAWHRLYVEALVPPETSFTLALAATDRDEISSEISDSNWHPHHFGGRPLAAGAANDAPSPYDLEPLAAWVPARSEIPGFDGFLPDLPEKNRTGLFTTLIQRAHRLVRTLRGRFLHLRVELRGDGRASPCLHAIRAYAPRFSYQDKYLPALYREQEFGPEAEQITMRQPSTRADFLGRFLANFEGVLTPLEDKIASAWLWTEPRKTPDQALDWLGSWIGVAFEPWYPAERRRDHLRRAPELFHSRGTLDGLRLALDVAIGGGAIRDGSGRQRIVVVEDFWMRRTLATVLGVNLDRVFDPLFGGPLYTGNSKVGRTLFLTEGIKREALALFDADIPLNTDDQAAVDEFFASLAHRATVIVHETVSAGEFNLIERVTALETPAHTVVRVRRASQDFMVGLAALLGVDTYLRPPPPAEAVEVDASTIGGGALLLRPPSLDPRIEGASS